MRPTILLALAAASVAFAQPHENLNAVVWMQTAAEYRATALQTYRAAEVNMLRALHDPNWTAALEQKGDFVKKPPAVILDLDETVLDNSPFQARGVLTNRAYSNDEWTAWVAEKRAGLIPGAAQFLAAAHANGVGIFYITNRTCDATKPTDPTVQLVRALGIPLDTTNLLCKAAATDPSDKSPRRKLAAAGHRVLLLVGDDLNDFITLDKDRSTVEGRQAAVDAYGRYWGERWFMLPNPTYGSWERSIGYEVPKKREALRK